MKNTTVYPVFEDSAEIYEIVRIALANRQMFVYLMDEMDFNESELEQIQTKINKAVGSD